MNNKSALSRVVITSIIVTGLSGIAEPEGKDIARKTAKQKGVIEPSEVLKFETKEKDIPKDWVKLDNKYFSVSYPKCFKIVPEGEEDDPKLATSILLERGINCLGYKESWNEWITSIKRPIHIFTISAGKLLSNAKIKYLLEYSEHLPVRHP